MFVNVCVFYVCVFLFCSQQPFPERLRIRVSRISMHDYEALHYDKEKLKEACEYEIQHTHILMTLKHVRHTPSSLHGENY